MSELFKSMQSIKVKTSIIPWLPSKLLSEARSTKAIKLEFPTFHTTSSPPSFRIPHRDLVGDGLSARYQPDRCGPPHISYPSGRRSEECSHSSASTSYSLTTQLATEASSRRSWSSLALSLQSSCSGVRQGPRQRGHLLGRCGSRP